MIRDILLASLLLALVPPGEASNAYEHPSNTRLRATLSRYGYTQPETPTTPEVLGAKEKVLWTPATPPPQADPTWATPTPRSLGAPLSRGQRVRAKALRNMLRNAESLTDEEILQMTGTNPQTGVTNNPSKRAHDLEIDSWAGATLGSKTKIKVGPSLVIWRPGTKLLQTGNKEGLIDPKNKQNPFKLCLDASDQFVGLSGRLDILPVIHGNVGGGVGRDFDEKAFKIYGVAAFKVW